MAYPDDLPTRTDESLGRTKVNTSTFTSTSQQADANEYNRILDTIVAVAASLGLPTGATASSAWQAILGGLGGCQYITTTDNVDENVSAVHVGAGAITVTLGDVADGKSRTIMLRVTDAAGGFDLACTGTGAQFADIEDTTRTTNNGVYLLHGYRVGASLVWLVSRIDSQEIEAIRDGLAWGRNFGSGNTLINGGTITRANTWIDLAAASGNVTVDLPAAGADIEDTGDAYSFDKTFLIGVNCHATHTLTLDPGADVAINGGAVADPLLLSLPTSGTAIVIIRGALFDDGVQRWLVHVVVSTALASSSTPAAVGTAAVGTSADYARADHVHAMPTSGTIALGSASITTSGTFDGRDVSADGAVLDALADGYVEGVVTASGSLVLPANMRPGSLKIWGRPGAGGGGRGGAGGAGQSSASGTGGGGGGGGKGGGGAWLWPAPSTVGCNPGDTLTIVIGAGGNGDTGSGSGTGSLTSVYNGATEIATFNRPHPTSAPFGGQTGSPGATGATGAAGGAGGAAQTGGGTGYQDVASGGGGAGGAGGGTSSAGTAGSDADAIRSGRGWVAGLAARSATPGSGGALGAAGGTAGGGGGGGGGGQGGHGDEVPLPTLTTLPTSSNGAGGTGGGAGGAGNSGGTGVAGSAGGAGADGTLGRGGGGGQGGGGGGAGTTGGAGGAGGNGGNGSDGLVFYRYEVLS